MKPTSLLRNGLLTITLLSVTGTARADISQSLWKNPVFQKRLQGSFGFNSEIEPGMTETEQADYDQITPLLQSEPEEALEYLTQLSQLENASPRFDFLIGNIHFQAERKREAVAAFKTALDKFPDYRQAHNNLAILYVQMGQQKLAIPHFTEAIRLGAVDGTTFGLLGLCYVTEENFLAAEQCFREAIVLSPEVKDWEMGLIQSLYSQEEFEEVISMLNRMIRKDPSDDKLWMLQANAYLGEKEILEAATNFEIVDQMGKLPAANLNTLADIYANEGMLDVAADAYLRAFERDESESIEGPVRAAEILLAREGYAAAKELLEDVRDSAEDLDVKEEVQILRLQAKIGMAEGAEDEAAKTLEEVVVKDPLDGESIILLGQYHQRNSDMEKAANLFEQAAGIKGHEANASVRLAQLKVGQGKYEEAIPLLKRAQDLNPQDSVARFLEDLERFVKGRR